MDGKCHQTIEDEVAIERETEICFYTRGRLDNDLIDFSNYKWTTARDSQRLSVDFQKQITDRLSTG
jgi:hypothetical protein